LVAATFIVILNETVMFNALPSLKTEFDVSLTTAQWLSTAFMLTMAVVIPVTGWFLQRVTTRQAFGTAMGVFCAGTLLAALAPTFPVLLAARIVQGSGTAVMMPLLMTTLMTIVAPQDRGRIMGNVTLAMSVAPALGPTFSGLIIDNLSWRWMFGLVLPIAGGIAVVGLSRLRNVGERSGASVHVPSVLIAAIGFGTLVFGLSEFGRGGSRLEALVFVGVGALFVAGFVLLQVRLQRVGAPLLDLRTLGHRTYRLGLITMAAAFAGLFGSMLILPTYLQGARELSPFQTGLLMMPGGLAMGLLGPRVGRWFDRFGGRRLVVPGGLGMALSLGILTTQISLTTPIWLVLVAHVLMMVSLALILTPVFTLALGDVPPHLYSHASSLLGTLQQVAGAMGVAIVATLISARTTSLVGDGKDLATASVGAMTWAFGFGAILAVVVLVLLSRLPNRPATPPHGPAPDDLLPEPAQSS